MFPFIFTKTSGIPPYKTTNSRYATTNTGFNSLAKCE